MTTYRQSRRVRAVAALSVALSLAGASALAAPGPDYGNIDPKATGSITLYKHEHQTKSPAVVGDPTKAEDTLANASNPVAGVEFTVFPFAGLALTGDKANENWAKLSEAAKSEALKSACDTVATTGKPTLAGFTFNAGQKMPVTDKAGKSTLGNLAVGGYLLCETKKPANVVTPAAPFIVTIPYPDTTRDGASNKWVYDVTAFPKNSVGGVTKTVDPQKPNGYGLGSVVTFPVTAKIPTLEAGTHFKYFILEDPMDERFTDLGVTKVVYGTDGAYQELAANTDYTLTVQGQKVIVSLTREGLNKIETKQGQNVQVVFKGTVAKLGDGKVKNKANFYSDTEKKPGVPPTTPPPEVPPTETPEVETWWGNGKIQKYDAADTTKKALVGAKFQVFEAATPYPENGQCTNAVAEGAQPIKVSGKDVFVSDANGVLIEGLFVSDSEHDPKKAQSRCYVLKEIAAPDGFVLPKDGKELTPLKITVGETAEKTYDASIPNTKTNVPNLPLTGSEGQMVLIYGGGILILLGAGLYLVRRSRKQAA